jgi:two-component system copper resistance phosphate regulon response regulator CusR
VKRILIAEDEARIASFVEKGLRADGFTPTVVGDGQLALEHALTGFTVLRRLREHGSALPVVILTARDSLSDTLAGLEGGADDYVAKPFRFGAAGPDSDSSEGLSRAGGDRARVPDSADSPD